MLVRQAGVHGLAGALIHDIVLGEENVRGIQNVLGAISPF